MDHVTAASARPAASASHARSSSRLLACN